MGERRREPFDDREGRCHDENYIPGIEDNHCTFLQTDETNTCVGIS